MSSDTREAVSWSDFDRLDELERQLRRETDALREAMAAEDQTSEQIERAKKGKKKPTAALAKRRVADFRRVVERRRAMASTHAACARLLEKLERFAAGGA